MSGLNGILLALCFIAALFLLWRDSMRARELAVSICRDICRRHEVQFLDDTVSLSRISLRRHPPRGLALHRVYTFEFSADGATRSTGTITITSNRVEGVFLPGVTSYLEH